MKELREYIKECICENRDSEKLNLPKKYSNFINKYAEVWVEELGNVDPDDIESSLDAADVDYSNGAILIHDDGDDADWTIISFNKPYENNEKEWDEIKNLLRKNHDIVEMV